MIRKLKKAADVKRAAKIIIVLVKETTAKSAQTNVVAQILCTATIRNKVMKMMKRVKMKNPLSSQHPRKEPLL